MKSVISIHGVISSKYQSTHDARGPWSVNLVLLGNL
jgi:hypothetical protein